VTLLLMVEGNIYIYLSSMLGSLNTWDRWKLARWVGNVIDNLVQFFQVVVKALIYASLCLHLIYWNFPVVMTLIPCGYFGFWYDALKAKRNRLVGVWDD
jgi:hypothetical protein